MPNKGAMQLGGGWSSACHSRPGRVRPYKVAPATRMWFVHRTKGSQVVSKDQLGIRTLVTRAPNVREQEALKTEKVVLVRDVVNKCLRDHGGAGLPCGSLGGTRLGRVVCTVYQQNFSTESALGTEARRKSEKHVLCSRMQKRIKALTLPKHPPNNPKPKGGEGEEGQRTRLPPQKGRDPAATTRERV